MRIEELAKFPESANAGHPHEQKTPLMRGSLVGNCRSSEDIAHLHVKGRSGLNRPVNTAQRRKAPKGRYCVDCLDCLLSLGDADQPDQA
jgi:hypothetical protein